MAQRRARTPSILQMEEQDCGAACLAIVLAYHGRHVPLHELREACSVSRDGATAASILRAARSYGLVASGRRAGDGESVAALAVPAIVLTSPKHFVVLEGCDGSRVWLNDPARGRRAVEWSEFAASFGGVALVFVPGVRFAPGGERFQEWRLAARLLRPHARALLYSVLLGLLVAAPLIVASLLAKVFAERVLLASTSGWIPLFVLGGAAAAGVAAVTAWLQLQTIARLQTKLAAVTAGEFFWRLLHLRRAFFSLRAPGGLVTRIQATDAIALLLSGRIPAALAAAVTMAAYLVAMLYFDARLAGLVAALAAVSVIALHLVARWRALHSERLAHEQQARDGLAFAGLASIESIKADGGEGTFFARWARHQARALNASQRLDTTSQQLLVLPISLGLIASFAIVIVGGFEVLHDSLGLGTFVAMQILATSFMGPLGSLVGVAADVQAARGQLTLLLDVLQAPVETGTLEDDELEGESMCLRGSLELADVTFGYATDQPPILDRVTFSVSPGERVAIVGATGSGKSTLARLLVGLETPWSGQVLFDGIPRERYPRSLLTSGIAHVDQRVHLFEGSVADNLRLWDDTLPSSALRSAVADAAIAETIERRGGPEVAWVQEGGRNFSGGERQRLDLARALAIDPAILVLDEATSAVDTEVEAEIDANLRRRGCTTVVLAHRLSTIRESDRIVVLERGHVVESGSHDDLIAAGGAYTALVAQAS